MLNLKKFKFLIFSLALSLSVATARPSWGGTDYLYEHMRNNAQAACHLAKACFTFTAFCIATAAATLGLGLLASPYCIFSYVCAGEMGAHHELGHAADGHESAHGCWEIDSPPGITYCKKIGGNAPITSLALANVCCQPHPNESQQASNISQLPDCNETTHSTAAVAKFAQAVRNLSQAASGALGSALSLLSNGAAADTKPPLLAGTGSAATSVDDNRKKGGATGDPLSAGIPQIPSLPKGGGSGGGGSVAMGGEGAAAGGGGEMTATAPTPTSAPMQMMGEEAAGAYGSGGGGDAETGGGKRSATSSVGGGGSKTGSLDFNAGVGTEGGDSASVTGGDPEDYFTRTGLDENLFKKVSAKYFKVATAWELSDSKKEKESLKKESVKIEKK